MNMYNDVSIFIISKNGDIIPPSEYNHDFDEPIDFIMLTNDDLNNECNEDNTIYLNLKYIQGANGDNLPDSVFEMRNKVYKNVWNSRIVGSFIWQADINTIPNFDSTEYKKHMCDFEGYKHTIDIINQANLMFKEHNDNKKMGHQYYSEIQKFYGELDDVEQMFPAVFAAHTTYITHNGKKYNGYLPSIGQLLLLSKNENIINNIIIKIIHSNILLQIRNSNFWSSSQCDFMRSFNLNDELTYNSHKCEYTYKVLPLFALTK